MTFQMLVKTIIFYAAYMFLAYLAVRFLFKKLKGGSK